MTLKNVLLLFIAVFSTVSLFSHPPQAVNLSYDPVASILEVTIRHEVRDPEDHFISEVSVSLNKKEIISQYLSKQENAKETKLLYKIFDAAAGDEIVVNTKCNKFGNRTGKITVSAPAAKPAAQPDRQIK